MKNIMDNYMFGGVRLKKLKVLISIITVFAIVTSFSGCSFRLTSFDNLMRPPKLIGKYQGLQDAFENAVKEKFSFLYFILKIISFFSCITYPSMLRWSQ